MILQLTDLLLHLDPPQVRRELGLPHVDVLRATRVPPRENVLHPVEPTGLALVVQEQVMVMNESCHGHDIITLF